MDDNLTDLIHEWNEELAKALIPNNVILGLYLLFGVSGNILVILVYTLQMKKKSEDRYFIPVLAVSDLFACIVCAGMAIALNLMQTEFTNDRLCKSLWFFAAGTTAMSVLLLTIIATHRYLKVCRPLRTQMSLAWKRVALGIAICLSILIGSPAAVLYGSVEFSSPGRNITGLRCSKLKDVSKIGSLMYSGLVALILITCIVLLIVFYGKIGRTIFVHFTNMKKAGIYKSKGSKELNSGNDTKSNELSSGPPTGLTNIELENKVASLENSRSCDNSVRENEVSVSSIQSPETGNHQAKKAKSKQKPDAEEKNRTVMYKFTLMFMTITIVFLICYVPKVILMAMEGRNPKFWESMPRNVRTGVLFTYRLYILNNVINPYIYAFLDEQFRKDALRLLRFRIK